MIFAGWATLLDPDFLAAMAFATCAEDASEAAEARLAISFHSFADNDSGMLEAFMRAPVGLGAVAPGDAFAASGVSTRAEGTETAAEMRRIFDLNI